MKNLKNQKTLERLKAKAVESKNRMPSLKMVARLLDELEIENTCHNISIEKWSKPSGFRHFTSGGSRTYNGFDFRVPEINMRLDSTESYYSWNTWLYARQLVELIEKTNDLKKP